MLSVGGWVVVVGVVVVLWVEYLSHLGGSFVRIRRVRLYACLALLFVW